jgi:hypothetical protein
VDRIKTLPEGGGEAPDATAVRMPVVVGERTTILRHCLSFALLGGAAFLLLGLVEWADFNVRATPYIHSLGERLTLTAYFSLNVVVGLIGPVPGCGDCWIDFISIPG